MLEGLFCFASARKQAWRRRAANSRPGREGGAERGERAGTAGTAGPSVGLAAPAARTAPGGPAARAGPAGPRCGLRPRFPPRQRGPAAEAAAAAGARPWQSSLGALRGGRSGSRPGESPCPRSVSSAGGRKKGSPGCWTRRGAAPRLPQDFQTRLAFLPPPNSNANRSLSEAAPPSPRPLPEPSLGAPGAAGRPCGAAAAERSLAPLQAAGEHFFWFYFKNICEVTRGRKKKKIKTRRFNSSFPEVPFVWLCQS